MQDPSLKITVGTNVWQQRINLSPCFSLILLLYLLYYTNSASAQSINPVTPKPPEQTPPNPLPPTSPPIQIPSTPPPTPDEVLDIPGTITVQRFEFVGNTAFSQGELNSAIANFTGKPITFAELLKAANQITELYVQRGYITSGAYIPAQEFRSGVIKVQVVEGGLSDIQVNVIKGRLNPDYVRSRIAIATNKPLNINRLQEALQLLQLNPLIESLDAELTAGTRPGVNALTVTVRGAKTFSAQLNLNNNRNPSVGSLERSIAISEASLLGLGDRFNFTYKNTDGSNSFEGGYTLPVNARNGSIGFNYRISNNKIIEPPFNELDIAVDSREFELSFRQPILQRATPDLSQELTLSFTAARRESNSSIQGVNFPLFPGADNQGETRLSALSFAQEWLQRSRQEVFAARSEFNLGIGAFNATVNNSEPDSRYFLWRGQLIYLRLLAQPKTQTAIAPTLLLRSNVQLATTSLLSLEQFSLGGQGTVRGYRQDALLSDNGFFASAELRLPIANFPQVKGTLQVAPFIDFGTVWNTGRENSQPNTLVGTGLGLLWQMGEQFTARFDWGIPLVNLDTNKRTWQDNGLYFQLEYKAF
ncbi:ShlB/FhaC/HecB family hemolysin secretion/activation protein [Tolypothrix sp. FACHB-123]|uniref:ShlB/FhaC/HecB family hemolysin secretion/activation protein n=1 Tax=Tolypothrix sp. FACHB-123 TaxID=2692868 RepID=UPI001684A919|nr:ShlB/FhaC/HecB family hemolysin secretion/activation protein [Tolypothrix sp. FACHB-123]MBD2355347.1 ShlB/FhaC/HecB family hemolysin secretion/activation protein [Tolypothrix sp. FACHB-123]